MDNGNREKFDKFLAWLHPDRDLAAARYVTIRNGLVKYFARQTCHGNFSCPHAEELADETLDRVINKMHEVDPARDTNPEARIYIFAKYVRLEHFRRPQPEALPPEILDRPDLRADEANEKERESDCCEQCLGTLTAGDRRLMLEYFNYTGQERIQRRRQLAEAQHITMSNLRTTACRLRKELEDCIRKCLKK